MMRLNFRRFIRDRKGGASVAIAVMMAMILAVSFVNNILIWGQVLSSEDRERMNEKIEIKLIGFDYVNSTYTKLKVDVTNTGSVTVHVVAMYVTPSNKIMPTVRYGVSNGINAFIDPADTRDVVPGNFKLNPSQPLEPEIDDFTVTVVTARGNSAVKIYTYETSTPYIREVGEMGVFRTNWFYSKYSSSTHPTNPLNAFADPPAEGFQISDGDVTDAALIWKGETYVAFYLEVKNVWNVPCAILPDS